MKRRISLLWLVFLVSCLLCSCGNSGSESSLDTEMLEDGTFVIHNESGDSSMPKEIPFSMEYNGKELICKSVEVYESYENYGYTPWVVVTLDATALDDAEYHWLKENDNPHNFDFTGDVSLNMYLEDGKNQLSFESMDAITCLCFSDKYLVYGFYSKKDYKYSFAGTTVVPCFSVRQDEKYEYTSSDGTTTMENKEMSYQTSFAAGENLKSPEEMMPALIDYFNAELKDKHIGKETTNSASVTSNSNSSNDDSKSETNTTQTASVSNPTCEIDGIVAEISSVKAGSSYVDLIFKITNKSDHTINIDSCRRNYINGISVEQFGTIDYDAQVESGKSTLYELTMENSSASVAGTTINGIELNVNIDNSLYTFTFDGLNISTKAQDLRGITAEAYKNVEATLVGAKVGSSYADFYFRLENKSSNSVSIQAGRRHYINDVSVEQFGTIDYESNIPAQHGTVLELTVEKGDLQASGNSISKVELIISVDGEEHSFIFDGINYTY